MPHGTANGHEPHTGKVASLSGNYFVAKSATTPEVEGAGEAVGIGIEFTTETGLLPLDIAWFLRVFSKFDRDNSGAISASELSEVMRFLGQNPMSFEVELMIEAADTSKDGTISFAEFLYLMEQLPASGSVIEECFAVLDKDGTGTISREELHSVLTTEGEPLSEEEFGRMMSYADKNGDGQIDYREFAALLIGSSSKVVEEMAQITDLDIMLSVQEARSNGYTSIKRSPAGLRATEYITPKLLGPKSDGPGAVGKEPEGEKPGKPSLPVRRQRASTSSLSKAANGNGMKFGIGTAQPIIVVQAQPPGSP